MVRLQEEVKEFMTCRWGKWGSFYRGPLPCSDRSVDPPSITARFPFCGTHPLLSFPSPRNHSPSVQLFFNKDESVSLSCWYLLVKKGWGPEAALGSSYSALCSFSLHAYHRAAALEGARCQGCHGLTPSTLVSLFGFFRMSKAQGDRRRTPYSIWSSQSLMRGSYNSFWYLKDKMIHLLGNMSWVCSTLAHPCVWRLQSKNVVVVPSLATEGFGPNLLE